MLQVATFKISSSLFGKSQEREANEFLKANKPVGNINFDRDTIVVFYEDDPHEPLHRAFPSSGWLMRVLHSVVTPPPPFTEMRDPKITTGCPVKPQVSVTSLSKATSIAVDSSI